MERSCRRAALAVVLSVMFAAIPAGASDEIATIRVWDFHVHDKKFKKEAFKEFNKANPDIKVEYTSQVTGSYQAILEAAVRSGDPPDIFVATLLPGGLLKAVEMGWLRPLDDVAPNKEELLKWIDTFPLEQAPFLEGVNMVNGKHYSWPSGIQDFAMMLYWNTKSFQEAGLKGPDGVPAVPETLADVRQFAKKVTELGQGKVYGIVHGIKSPSIWDQDLFQPAYGEGWYDINWKTGRYDYTHPGLRAHIQMWLDMKKDGSVFPGDLGMDDEQAKFKFAQGLAGMIYGGYWVPGGLLALDTSVEFDTVLSPTEERGKRKGGIPGGGMAASSEYAVSSKTKNPGAAWRVVEFMTSKEYQEGWVKAGAGFSVFAEYNRPEYFPHPTLAKMAAAAAMGRKLGPDIALSADARRVSPLMETSQPNEKETMQGVWIGKLGWDAWDDLTRRRNAEFDKALAEARKRGINVAREDFTFPDWDPSKNYVPKPRK